MADATPVHKDGDKSENDEESEDGRIQIEIITRGLHWKDRGHGVWSSVDHLPHAKYSVNDYESEPDFATLSAKKTRGRPPNKKPPGSRLCRQCSNVELSTE